MRACGRGLKDRVSASFFHRLCQSSYTCNDHVHTITRTIRPLSMRGCGISWWKWRGVGAGGEGSAGETTGSDPEEKRAPPTTHLPRTMLSLCTSNQTPSATNKLMGATFRPRSSVWDMACVAPNPVSTLARATATSHRHRASPGAREAPLVIVDASTGKRYVKGKFLGKVCCFRSRAPVWARACWRFVVAANATQCACRTTTAVQLHSAHALPSSGGVRQTRLGLVAPALCDVMLMPLYFSLGRIREVLRADR